MIDTRRLKKFVILIKTVLSFVLSRKIINIFNNIAQKCRKVTVKDLRKYEKLECKKNQLKLDIDFLKNSKQLGVYPKFLIFKLPNVANKTLYQFVKDFFVEPSISVINNSNIFQKNLVYANTFHLRSFLLLASTSIPNIYHHITSKRCRNQYIFDKKSYGH